MRELKFRAWCILDGKGSFIHFDLEDSGRFDWEVFDEPPIMQQYTGLKDKNGEEIYEGDILSTHIPDKKYYTNGEVIYSKEYLTYFVKYYQGGDYFSEYLSFIQNTNIEVEVIGNTYKNPDLLA